MGRLGKDSCRKVADIAAKEGWASIVAGGAAGNAVAVVVAEEKGVGGAVEEPLDGAS